MAENLGGDEALQNRNSSGATQDVFGGDVSLSEWGGAACGARA